MSGIAYRFATRLNSFRPPGVSMADALAAAAAVPGLDAVELNYPQHIAADDADDLLAIAAQAGLRVTALNMRYDDRAFARGAFTNPDSSMREAAVALTEAAVDLAARAGVPHVIVWPGPDGYDVPFQVDYGRLWSWLVDGLRRVADRQPDVRLSIEYKPSEPRRISLPRSMGETLLALADIDRPNAGVTLDFCHSLMAGEQPAAAAAMALQRGQLFGVHLNDGYGPADDGLMVGSVHLVQTLELLAQLRRYNFAGTLYFDTFPHAIDPAAECAANIAAVTKMEHILDAIDFKTLARLQQGHDAVAVTELVRAAVWGS